MTRRAQPSRKPMLLPGDTIEYGLTAEVRSPRKGTWWIKAGGTTTIQDGETDERARLRLRAFVHETLEQATDDVLE